jgi:hypothetical protein
MHRLIPWPLAVPMVLLAAVHAAGAGDRADAPRPTLDVRALYQRLEPGMPVETVSALAEGMPVSGAGLPVTTWVLWQHSGASRGTEVLRAGFQDGRLVRVEYESFGDRYRRRAKGDHRVPLEAAEVARLWRRSAEAEEGAAACREALEAFHELVMKAQGRLTDSEQQEWARALRLRRAAEHERP